MMPRTFWRRLLFLCLGASLALTGILTLALWPGPVPATLSLAGIVVMWLS